MCIPALGMLAFALQMLALPRPEVTAPVPSFHIPRMTAVPRLADFLDMAPDGRLAGQMAHVHGFVQRSPDDGVPATQRTDVYLGYGPKNLFIVFVCFDDHPKLIRAHLARREDIGDDDHVEVILDSFHDERRGYAFAVNPFGVQWDATYTEAQGSDSSFDTVWQSRGKLTSRGYVVLMEIPFRSLRFSPEANQNWGIVLIREIPRENESSYWPRVSATISGTLDQEGTMRGLNHISPGHNIQINPYVLAGGHRAIDSRNAAQPLWDKGMSGAVGMDAKMVVKDRLVIDATVHPDFSQVESDDPQVTVNQRYAVYYPEKRPFFLENANYFQTPFDLVFTRSIAAPDYGARVTGKLGDYAVGALIADDKSPGEIVPPGDPEYGKKATFAVMRVSRDFASQSSVGVIYTDREFDGGFNRVGGLDGVLKLDSNWSANFQGVTSSTLNTDGTTDAGPAYQANLQRNGRSLAMGTGYYDVGRDFETDLGYIYRPDVRSNDSWIQYYFHPEDSVLQSWGPKFYYEENWDHRGVLLDRTYSTRLNWNLAGQTSFSWNYDNRIEQLRPQDFSALTDNQMYPGYSTGFSTNFGYWSRVSFGGSYNWQERINYVPAAGAPYSGSGNHGNVWITLHPLDNLRIDNTYIIDMMHVLDDPVTLPALGADARPGDAIFNNHILRSNWNLQLNRAFSLRFIAQYNTVIANQFLSSLQQTRAFNADFLISYLVHPGTAFYVGYNSDLQNMDPNLHVDANDNILRTPNGFINDGRQFFVKIAYLFRM